MLETTYKTQVIELFKGIKKHDEFEVMFNNYKVDNMLSLIDFMNVMKYVKYRSELDKLELTENIILDVSYNEYRISVTGLDNINNFCSNLILVFGNFILSIFSIYSSLNISALFPGSFLSNLNISSMPSLTNASCIICLTLSFI